MTENLIKRYLLEKEYELGKAKQILEIGEDFYQKELFELLKQNKIKFDEEEFLAWLANLKKNKEQFDLYLMNNGYLSGKSDIFEVVEDESLLTGDFLTKKIIEPIGDSCSTKPCTCDLQGHLIINGIYSNQLIYLARICSGGTFTIGYCGGKDSLYTKRVIRYYKKIGKLLKIMTDSQYHLVEDSILDENKIYVLSYNPEKH